MVVNAPGTATLRRITSARNTHSSSAGFGGGLYLYAYNGGSFTVEDVVLEDNVLSGGFGGCAYLTGEPGARGVWTGAEIRGCGSPFGSAIFVNTGTWDISAADIRDNDTSDFFHGVVWVQSGATLRLSNSVLAGNTGGVSVGGSSATAASLTLSNVDVVGNGHPSWGASAQYGVACQLGGRLTMTNVTSANNLGYGILANSCTTSAITHSNLFANGAGAVSGLSSPTGTSGNIAVSPGYTFYSSAVSASLWDLTLAPGSALIDAGSPSVLDVDGTRSDIGAYGGPGGAW
jgi:hypothetical protein